MVIESASVYVGGKKMKVCSSDGQLVHTKRESPRNIVAKELLSAAKRVALHQAPARANALFENVIIPRAPRTNSTTVARKPSMPILKPLSVPDGVRNIRLFARVQTKNGDETVLKPVHVMVSSQVEVEKLRTELSIREASLNAERARTKALEMKLNLLRAQLECKVLKVRLRDMEACQASKETPRLKQSMDEQARNIISKVEL
jgi:hypothetical protein